MITQMVEKSLLVQRCKGYAHQDVILEAHWQDRYYALFWEMGLGKTKTTIDMACKLYLAGQIDGVLIIAPKAAYLNWVYEELPKHIPANIKYRVGYYSAYSTTKSRAGLNAVMTAQDDVLDFMAINIEAVATVNGFQAAGLFAKSHYTMCVIDESSRIKSYNAKRTKSTLAIGRMCDYRRALTGTPMTQNPLDLYSQIEFLNPKLSGHASFFSFRSQYATIIQIPMGPRMIPKIAGFRNLEDLSRRLQEFSDRRLKKDCLDLPDKVFETVFVEWTQAQNRAYRALREEAMHQLDQGLVSSTSALTTLMKLHQINCGHVKLDDGTIQVIESNRLDTLMDILQDLPGKVIIWARFRKDIEMIASRIREDYGEDSYAVYYGATSQVNRLDGLHAFRHTDGCRFFVANAASAGMSITLVEATTAIYYSLSYSLEEWLQSQDRNHRIGQTQKVTYITLAVQNTVDTKLIGALMTKKDLASTVLDSYRELLTID